MVAAQIEHLIRYFRASKQGCCKIATQAAALGLSCRATKERIILRFSPWTHWTSLNSLFENLRICDINHKSSVVDSKTGLKGVGPNKGRSLVEAAKLGGKHGRAVPTPYGISPWQHSLSKLRVPLLATSWADPEAQARLNNLMRV